MEPWEARPEPKYKRLSENLPDFRDRESAFCGGGGGDFEEGLSVDPHPDFIHDLGRVKLLKSSRKSLQHQKSLHYIKISVNSSVFLQQKSQDLSLQMSAVHYWIQILLLHLAATALKLLLWNTEMFPVLLVTPVERKNTNSPVFWDFLDSIMLFLFTITNEQTASFVAVLCTFWRSLRDVAKSSKRRSNCVTTCLATIRERQSQKRDTYKSVFMAQVNGKENHEAYTNSNNRNVWANSRFFIVCVEKFQTATNKKHFSVWLCTIQAFRYIYTGACSVLKKDK